MYIMAKWHKRIIITALFGAHEFIFMHFNAIATQKLKFWTSKITWNSLWHHGQIFQISLKIHLKLSLSCAEGKHKNHSEFVETILWHQCSSGLYTVESWLQRVVVNILILIDDMRWQMLVSAWWAMTVWVVCM